MALTARVCRGEEEQEIIWIREGLLRQMFLLNDAPMPHSLQLHDS